MSILVEHITRLDTLLIWLSHSGFTQFADVLPDDHIKQNRDLIVSHMEPFAARLDIEIIKAPHPVNGKRSEGDKYTNGGETKYIHFILNQRTLSHPECPERDDGWCELTTFLGVLQSKLAEAEYEYSCFGKWPVVDYGKLKNGVPPKAGGSSVLEA